MLFSVRLIVESDWKGVSIESHCKRRDDILTSLKKKLNTFPEKIKDRGKV
jgi:hypothetical protein